MSVFTIPLAVVFGAVTVLAFALGVRRLLGLPFSATRTLAAAVLSFFLASPIITAIGGPTVTGSRSVLPALWFIMLGVASAVLVGMVFLVAAEALVPSGSLPGMVSWGRALRRLAGRTRRYAQISRIVARHGLGPYVRGARRSELRSAEGRARLARTLAHALEEAGVTFVKLGQVLAARRDLLPEEFTDAFSRLQDQAAPVPWPQVEYALRTELDVPPGDVFAHLEKVPLAAASIAQVHAARLRTGEEVVVKVRRPGVWAVAQQDMDIITRLARMSERNTRWARRIGAVTLARGFADALREEMDLRTEARNIRSVSAAAASRRADGAVEFPLPCQDISTAGVLVMRRLHGTPLRAISPADAADGRARLARTLLHALLTQIMTDGVFHADPHPGNILLLEDGRVGLLDFGSVGRLDSTIRGAMRRLLLSLDRSDPAMLTDCLLEITEPPEELDEHRLERELGRFMARHLTPGTPPSLQMFTDLFRVVCAHGLAIPPEAAAVFRALATLEGSLTQMAPGFDIITEARRYAASQLAGQSTPQAIASAATDELAALLPLLRRLPRHVDRIAAAAGHGRLSINVRLFANRDDRQTITGMLHQALLTVLAASAGITAVLMLAVRGGPAITQAVSLYQFLGYCLLVTAGILALRVLIMIFRSSRV